MSDVMIPPWVRPESPEILRIIDDATLAFVPAFGRGTTQRGIWADPRWGLRRRYRGLRSDQKAAILNALNETRGQLNVIRVTPHAPIRGSMPTGELITNNTFENGTTGWSSDADYALTVSDRVLRSTRVSMTGSAVPILSSNFTVTPNVPYIVRAMILQGRGAYATGFRVNNSPSFGTYTTDFGLKAQAFVPSTSSDNMSVSDGETTGLIAGDYIQIPYVSYARGALVDNSPNLFTQSDAFDNAAWTKARSSVTPSSVAPDASAGADQLIEDATASNSHYVQQTATVSSAAADYSAYVYARASTRSWMWIQVVEATGNSVCTLWVNLSTGAKGATPTTGTNWSNLRTFVTSMGNAWYRVHLVARKTNAATSILVRIGLTTGDNVTDYTGNGTSSILLWRGGLAQSSFPTDPRGTTASASTTGNPQSGSRIYTKGWPVSTSGLLLSDDWFEINGELKQLTAPVSSDAAGLAYMQFRPGLAGAPADSDPIVVHEPFGRFIYPAGARELENQFGIYADCTMDLEEVYV